jgi:hypothetical protein
MKRFNLKKLNEVEGNEKYHVQVSNRFAALEDLNMWNLKVLVKQLERISKFQAKTIGYYELRKHKPWFDKRCSKLLDQMK